MEADLSRARRVQSTDCSQTRARRAAGEAGVVLPAAMLPAWLLQSCLRAQDDRCRPPGNGWDAATACALALLPCRSGCRANHTLRLRRGDADCLAKIWVEFSADRGNLHLSYARGPCCGDTWHPACCRERRSYGANSRLRARGHGWRGERAARDRAGSTI